VDNDPVPAPDAFSLTEGTVFHDQYEVVRRIDSGAMGAVYEVIDSRTKRRRALKLMLARFADNPDVTERFRREATITADVLSEHIVETFDAGVDDDTKLPFMVMELLRGEDLGKVVARGPIPAEDVVTLLIQAASALDKTHTSGVIHRDLKPENLYVTRRDDGSPRLKILDFGIAKVIEKSATSATSTRNMGTPVYMSPEQVTGDGTVGPAADLYALGHLAYAMLVGEPYWLQDALVFETVYPLLLRIMQGATEPASERAARKGVELPPAFDAWFARATAITPDERFKSASESIVALAEALSVARPMLPSWVLERVAVATAPTLSPPDGAPGADDIPIPLIPPAPRAPREHEPSRTLSPVSTLPDIQLSPSGEHRQPRRRRALLGFGAMFFTAGVLLAVFVVRSARPPTRLGSTLASLPSIEIASAAGATTRTLEPAPALVAPDPAATSASTSEPAPGDTTSPPLGPSAVAPPPSNKPRTPQKSAYPAAKPSSGPARTYGDPSRDL